MHKSSSSEDLWVRDFIQATATVSKRRSDTENPYKTHTCWLLFNWHFSKIFPGWANSRKDLQRKTFDRCWSKLDVLTVTLPIVSKHRMDKRKDIRKTFKKNTNRHHWKSIKHTQEKPRKRHEDRRTRSCEMQPRWNTPTVWCLELTRVNEGGHKFGWKKFKDFSRTSKYVFKTYFSDVLLRCRHIKSNRINSVLLTVVTTQQVMWCISRFFGTL